MMTGQQVVVTSGMVVVVGLVSLLLGIWYGIRRGFEQAKEEIRWEREEAAARAHQIYREPPTLWERAHEAQPDWEDQALTIANETIVLEPTAVLSPDELSTTAWTRRMAEDMDRFIAGLIRGTDEQLREITR